jgi:hypothetical protein
MQLGDHDLTLVDDSTCRIHVVDRLVHLMRPSRLACCDRGVDGPSLVEGYHRRWFTIDEDLRGET